MKKLPDFNKAIEYENYFYQTSQVSRLGKALAQYELFKMSNDISGDIVECGILKGASFCRLAMFRQLFGVPSAKKIIGFDSFRNIVKTKFSADKIIYKKFTSEFVNQIITKKQLLKILKHKGVEKNIQLIAGDILDTVPKYLKSHPELRISLLNLDVDFYEPAAVILENLYSRISKGGILMIDNYGVGYEGETRAVVKFFKDKKIKIKRSPYTRTPSFVIKN